METQEMTLEEQKKRYRELVEWFRTTAEKDITHLKRFLEPLEEECALFTSELTTSEKILVLLEKLGVTPEEVEKQELVTGEKLLLKILLLLEGREATLDAAQLALEGI